ncbi:hypothetical protein [Hydrogenophaga sp. BPS33]|uniref:hypothetical protein n=1 Tax=Hydrogenophaga sp. BPS33 TaxID=2651974 RepID=UPI0013200C2C|nr:hypothetical protein [Hydrogenophaga sp. BPS33]QHE86750.1 hypothetical protein F9K07_18520 [Hydrogenophaga sp. BPS33]
MTTIQNHVAHQQTAAQNAAPTKDVSSVPTANAAVVIAKQIEAEKAVIADNLARIDTLTSKLTAVEKSAARQAEITDLKKRLAVQESELQIPNRHPKETALLQFAICETEARLAWLEKGQSRTDFWKGKLQEWKLEAGTLRSRLSDGGVTLDRRGIEMRLEWLDEAINEVSEDLEKVLWERVIN